MRDPGASVNCHDRCGLFSERSSHEHEGNHSLADRRVLDLHDGRG